MMTTEEITKTIVDRTRGIVDENKAEKVYKASGIEIHDNGKISLSKNAEETLDSLIENLNNEGGIIAKIMLRNLFEKMCQEYPKACRGDELAPFGGFLYLGTMIC